MQRSTPDPLADCNPAWKEISRLAEARLDAQLRLLIAADQRSSALAGVCVALTAASLSGVAAFASRGVDPFLIYGLLVLASGSLLASLFSILAAIPVALLPPGIPPSAWKKLSAEPKIDSLYHSTGALYEQSIEFNRAAQNRKHKLIALSLATLLLSIVLFVVLGVISLR